MNAPRRATISLNRQATSADREFRLDYVDVLVPCRQFTVAHKVAEVGTVSLVTEFLLRLIHAMQTIDEAGAASFFNFDFREMNFALSDLEANSYVDRRNGELSLTNAGRALFQHGQGTPQIYTVQNRTSTHGFDLLSFAPQEKVWLEQFELRLQELPVNAERVATASQEIRQTFKRFFGELSARSERDVGKHLSLYSIDSVTPERRFSSRVSFYLKATSTRPSIAEADLSSWRPPQELDDRSRIVESVAAYIETLKLNANPDDKTGYAQLLQFGGDFFKDFLRKDELAVDRFFSSTLARAGELRIDRPTVPIVGTFFVEQNTARLTEALRYGKKALGPNGAVTGLWWLAPDLHWGYTHVLPTLLEELSKELLSSPDNDFRTVGLARQQLPAHLNETFSEFAFAKDKTQVPAGLEILWIPRVLAAALIHAPLKAVSGVPVPLGFLSFDTKVIERIESFLRCQFQISTEVVEPKSS